MDHLIPDFITIMISNVFSVQDSKYRCTYNLLAQYQIYEKKMYFEYGYN